MLRWRSLFFGICFFYAGISFAGIPQKSCASPDYSVNMGPVRSQGSAKQCEAFVIADLMTYYQGLSIKNRVSALDVAATYVSSDTRDLYDGIHQLPGDNFRLQRELSLEYMKQVEKDRQSADGEKFSAGFSPEKRMSHGSYFSPMIEAYNLKGYACSETDVPSQNSELSVDHRDFFLNQVRKSSPQPFGRPCSLSQNNLGDVFRLNQQIKSDLAQKFLNNIENKCHRQPLKKMDFDEVTIKTPDADSPAATIISYLLRTNGPVAIGYDVGFLHKGRDYQFTSDDHASSIVQQRWSDQGYCEFKIRNSWGTRCEIYHQEFKDRCSGGEIWVREEDLNKYVSHISAIKK